MGPSLTGSDQGLRNLVAAAALAPSSHNTRPWLFRIGAHVVDLVADRTRARPVNDPHDRELTISCGCALLNLSVAAAAAGQQATVELLSDPSDEDLLARVRLWPGPPLPHLANLDAAIAVRRTCRERFADIEVGAGTAQDLAAAVQDEGATLTVLGTPSSAGL